MANLKYQLYRALRFALPATLQSRVAKASVSRPVRDWLFRPGGEEETVSGEVSWEDQQFAFTAPFQVFHRAATRGIENRICRLARSVLRPGDTAIDVGSSYGFITLVLAAGVQRQGVVVAMEIDPLIRRHLVRTIAANGLSEIVRVIPKGAGSADSAKLTTVDSIVIGEELGKVSFLKIDVDGQDLAVLQGAAEVLKRLQPLVVVEMTQDQDEIYETLLEAGYSHFMDQSNRPVRPDAWPPNLIASLEPVAVPPRGYLVG